HTGDEQRVSRPVITIATWGVAVGVCVMILSVCVTLGFQREIRGKVIGFGSHIQVVNAESLYKPLETNPIMMGNAMLDSLSHIEGVRHAQRFCQKPGMLKTEEAFRGVAFRGVGVEYDTTFLHRHLQEGRLPAFSDTLSSNEILVSAKVADQLRINLNDRVYAYFFEEKVRARRFTVVGIYNTNLADFDNSFIFTDLITVQKLWGWHPDQYSGAELLLADFNELDKVAERVSEVVDHAADPYGNLYLSSTIQNLYPQIFSWLDLLDMNVWVILILMLCVAGFTMVSGLLIIILERTNFIGVMKAMGADNDRIRHIFLFFAAMIIGRGLLWGNALAAALILCQEVFHPVTLDPQSYYVETVPLYVHIGYILLIDVFTMVVSVMALVVPSYLISNIHPARSIRFE
ncbi:MAG: ABC transporter permease, partial [Bacteroidaceae bacterium]|nr:ABC transporter permease [Bacteroidaceae bacterium]